MTESPDALRERMVQRLHLGGVVSSDPVYEAMRMVPRHCFLPGVDLRAAYADEAVVVKRAPDGSPLSSASQPTMVATMLEQLGARPGERVLEIGTGTGYNAALLARLVGPDGRVVTMELDRGLAGAAQARLRDLGAGAVNVVVGDGRLGYPPEAPYRRIIVTAGAPALVAGWGEQLSEGGRLVTPIVDHMGLGEVVVYEKSGGELVPLRRIACGFLPLREGGGGVDEPPFSGEDGPGL